MNREKYSISEILEGNKNQINGFSGENEITYFAIQGCISEYDKHVNAIQELLSGEGEKMESRKNLEEKLQKLEQEKREIHEDLNEKRQVLLSSLREKEGAYSGKSEKLIAQLSSKEHRDAVAGLRKAMNQEFQDEAKTIVERYDKIKVLAELIRSNKLDTETEKLFENLEDDELFRQFKELKQADKLLQANTNETRMNSSELEKFPIINVDRTVENLSLFDNEIKWHEERIKETERKLGKILSYGDIVDNVNSIVEFNPSSYDIVHHDDYEENQTMYDEAILEANKIRKLFKVDLNSLLKARTPGSFHNQLKGVFICALGIIDIESSKDSDSRKKHIEVLIDSIALSHPSHVTETIIEYSLIFGRGGPNKGLFRVLGNDDKIVSLFRRKKVPEESNDIPNSEDNINFGLPESIKQNIDCIFPHNKGEELELRRLQNKIDEIYKKVLSIRIKLNCSEYNVPEIGDLSDIRNYKSVFDVFFCIYGHFGGIVRTIPSSEIKKSYGMISPIIINNTSSCKEKIGELEHLVDDCLKILN